MPSQASLKRENRKNVSVQAALERELGRLKGANGSRWGP